MNKNEWETPDWLYNNCNKLYNFDIDAAANSLNHKSGKWFGPGSPLGVEDSLAVDWHDYGHSFWLNPPYGRGLMEPFIEKAFTTWKESFFKPRRRVAIIMLLPVDTSTGWWHNWIQGPLENTMVNGADGTFWVDFLHKRIKFVGAKGSPRFASCLVCLT